MSGLGVLCDVYGFAAVSLPGDEAPRVARIRGYFEIPALKRLADANPYYQGNNRNTGGGQR